APVRPAPPPEVVPRASSVTRPAAPERPPAVSPVVRNQLSDNFRAGYPQYLRSARVAEVAGLALPGVAGIVALTALGGLLGYRQAKAGHAVRAAGTARFLQ
ncbi:MAG: hypothetical protein WBB07_01860, partial [Mycobacterium sp.]